MRTASSASCSEVRRAGDVILFIDELHTIVGAGTAEGALDAANILKPALGRGEVQIIGATTPEEYRPPPSRRTPRCSAASSPCKVPEPDRAQTLRAYAPQPCAPSWSSTTAPQRRQQRGQRRHTTCPSRYISDRLPPRQGRRSARRGRRRGCTSPAQARGVTAQRRRRGESSPMWTGSPRRGHRPRTEAGTAAAESRGGAAPAASSGRTRPSAAVAPRDTPREPHRPHRPGAGPVGSFLLPRAATGVGKTELCRALAAGRLRRRERPHPPRHVGIYREALTVGAPRLAPLPATSATSDGGQLTEKVRRKPWSVVLFDEIEKAHEDVWSILLQIMDDGHLTDSAGRRVDFRNTVVVMTSQRRRQGHNRQKAASRLRL